MGAFWFQNLEIWKRAVVLDRDCFEPSDQLDRKQPCCIAAQVRAAAPSITKNTAEHSGSSFIADSACLLSIA